MAPRGKIALAAVGAAVLLAALVPWMRANLDEARRLEAENRQVDRPTPAPGDELEGARAATLTHPDDADARLRYAALLGQRRRYEEALVELAQAARLAPTRAEPHIALSEIYQVGNLFDMAIAHGRKAAALEPDNPRALHQLGYLYVAFDWHKAAADLLEPAVAKNPDFLPLRVDLAINRYQSHDYHGALAALQEVQRRDPASPLVAVPLIDTLMKLSRLKEADQVATAALATDPQNVTLLVRASGARLALGDAPGSEELARRAVALAPEDIDARYQLALSLRPQRRDDEAQAELEVVAAKNDNHLGVGQLAALYQKRGRGKEAAALRRRYADRQVLSQTTVRWSIRVGNHPDDAEAHLQLGLAYLRERRYTRALAELREAMRLNPAEKRVREPYAEALLATKRPQEAELARQGRVLEP